VSQVIIGMDPHKNSAAIEIMAADEAVVGGGRYGTDAAGYAAMLAGVRRWPDRIWAIEGCRGIGRHLASRLVADGEQVVDVPPKLPARTRVFTAGQGRKTDATGAHCVALAATRMRGLHLVTDDAQLEVLRVLAGRRRALGEDPTRMICQLHRLLAELIPGGAKRSLSAARALLARVRPRDPAGQARRRVAAELIAGLERSCRREKAAGKELAAALKATGTTLMTLEGTGPSGAARLLAEAADITRFPDRGHFASWNGTAPTGRLPRRPRPAPPVPRREPAGQPRAAHHGGSPAPPRDQGPRLLRPQGRRREDPERSHARAQAPALRRGVPADDGRRPRPRTGPGGHLGAATGSSAAGCDPDAGSSGKSLPGPAISDPTPGSHPNLRVTPAAIVPRRTAAAVKRAVLDGGQDRRTLAGRE
jgi:transposase